MIFASAIGANDIAAAPAAAANVNRQFALAASVYRLSCCSRDLARLAVLRGLGTPDMMPPAQTPHYSPATPGWSMQSDSTRKIGPGQPNIPTRNSTSHTKGGAPFVPRSLRKGWEARMHSAKPSVPGFPNWNQLSRPTAFL